MIGGFDRDPNDVCRLASALGDDPPHASARVPRPTRARLRQKLRRCPRDALGPHRKVRPARVCAAMPSGDRECAARLTTSAAKAVCRHSGGSPGARTSKRERASPPATDAATSRGGHTMWCRMSPLATHPNMQARGIRPIRELVHQALHKNLVPCTTAASGCRRKVANNSLARWWTPNAHGPATRF